MLCRAGRGRSYGAGSAPYTRRVNWAALLALLGTVVGASLTLLADRVRWRRDQAQHRYEVRRDAYAVYLTALHAASEGVRAVSLGEHPPEAPRPSAARTAFRSANLSGSREQLVLLAPAPIVGAADETFRSLRELRDLVGQGGGLESPGYQQMLTRYQLALKRLRNAMRADLGTPALDEDVTF
jgi:hypothetical protein